MALDLGPNIAHLNDDERVLVRRSGSEQNIGVELTRCAFDAVTEMFDKRRGSCAVKTAAMIQSVGTSRKKGNETKKFSLDEISSEDYWNWESSCFVACYDTKGRACASKCPPKISNWSQPSLKI